MDVARENDRLFDKTRRLVLDLLDATSLEDVVSTVEDSLRHEFQVPYVSLILFSDSSVSVGRSVADAGAPGHRRPALRRQDRLRRAASARTGVSLRRERPRRDRLRSGGLLSFQGLHGVLAIGSPDPQHYKSSLGTLFLGYVAEVLARVLPRFSSPLRSVR